MTWLGFLKGKFGDLHLLGHVFDVFLKKYICNKEIMNEASDMAFFTMV